MIGERIAVAALGAGLLWLASAGWQADDLVPMAAAVVLALSGTSMILWALRGWVRA